MQKRQIRGLTRQEVEQRIAEGKQNIFTDESSRSEKEIILSNVFTLFNLINLVLFILVLTTGSLKNGTFLIVAVVNTVIGTVQELRSKKVLDNLKLMNVSEVTVIRDNVSEKIPVSELVQDDLMILEAGAQVPADGVVLSGRVEANESLLTGESDSIVKDPGAEVMSGSAIVSGKAYVRVKKVGAECYAERIAREAKVFKKAPSQLRESINGILKWLTILIVPTGIAMYLTQVYVNQTGYQEAVLSTVSSMIGMIPEGLVLLTSMALAIGVMRLANKKTLVQELYCIETLARVDTLCLDKTGTLTEGRLEVAKVIPLIQEGAPEENAKRVLSAQDDRNETACALREYLGLEEQSDEHTYPSTLIPFSSERKFSGAGFEGLGTWYFGAYSFLFEEEKQDPGLNREIAEYARQGYRVLTLAHSPRVLGMEDKPEDLEAEALFLLTDVIRPEAPEILEYFRSQDVDIRIISGDDPITVGAIAARAGVKDSAPVNASELKDDEAIAEALLRAKVFGRVTPAQKEKMVSILQAQGHTVAMTGDGVNDVLALKKADCSIAMGNGSDAAKNVASLVLLDSNFASMPEIVKEGRRVINNIKRAASLFLIKTAFTILLSIMTILFGLAYPFLPVQTSIISAFGVGIPSFLLQMEPSFERVNGRFLRDVLKNSLPASFSIATFVLVMQLAAGVGNITMEQMRTAVVFATAFNYVLAQRRIYAPMTVYRAIVVSASQAAFLATVIFIGRSLMELTDLNLEMVAIVLFAVQLSEIVQNGYLWLLNLLIRTKNRILLRRQKRKEARALKRQKKNLAKIEKKERKQKKI